MYHKATQAKTRAPLCPNIDLRISSRLIVVPSLFNKKSLSRDWDFMKPQPQGER